MRQYPSTHNARWGGAVTVLAALLVLPLMGMLAFSIDLGYIAKIQNECQNVADSASLAGTSMLDSYASFKQVSDQTLRTSLQQKAVSSAQAEAAKYVNANTAGGVSLATDSKNDIQVGYWNTTAKTFTATTPPDANWPNAVQVTVRRDNSNPSTSNGSLPLFFAPVFGVKNINLQATATSTHNPATPQVNGLGGTETVSSAGGLLPFAVDVDSWNYYLQHGSVGPGASVIDDYSVPKGLGVGNAVSTGDGIPEFQVYPPPSLIHPSQKGLLSFDPSHFGGNGNTINEWIDPGPSGSELVQNFGSNGFQPPQALYGTPGNKTGHFDDLTGEIRIQPLIDYSQTTTGNHGQYAVVALALVQIVYGPDNTGIWVQPYSGPIPAAVKGTPLSSTYTYTDPTNNNSVTVPPFDPNILPVGYRKYVLVK